MCNTAVTWPNYTAWLIPAKWWIFETIHLGIPCIKFAYWVLYTPLFKSLRSVRLYYIICTKLSKSDSKDIYNVTKYISNNISLLKNIRIFVIKKILIIRNVSWANQHSGMISEGSCDTEDWYNDAGNSVLTLQEYISGLLTKWQISVFYWDIMFSKQHEKESKCVASYCCLAIFTSKLEFHSRAKDLASGSSWSHEFATLTNKKLYGLCAVLCASLHYWKFKHKLFQKFDAKHIAA